MHFLSTLNLPGKQAIAHQLQQQGIQQGLAQTLQQLIMFSQTAGGGATPQLPPQAQAQYFLQNQVQVRKSSIKLRKIIMFLHFLDLHFDL